MIKRDIGHLGCPFFEQKLDNGLNILFMPRNSRQKSALIYVNTGSFPHDEIINSTKMPFGCAYFLEKMIMSNKTIEELAKLHTVGKSHIDYSYTCYELSSLDDIFPSIQLVLNKITHLDYTEKDIDEFKTNNRVKFLARENNPLNIIEKTALENLYFESPISKGIYPTFNESISIHASTLNRFQSRYYQSSSMTIMVSGDYSLKEANEKLLSLKVPKQLTTYSREIKYSENYDKAREQYTELRPANDGNYLCFGIKLPQRKKLFEAFGELTFAFYEILDEALFRGNRFFKEGIKNCDADLLSYKIEQGGEDAYILLDFHCLNSATLINFLFSYFTRPEINIDHSILKSAIARYEAIALRNLSVPSTSLDGFAKALANNLLYPSLVNNVKTIKYKAFIDFIAMFTTFPKTTVFLPEE